LLIASFYIFQFTLFIPGGSNRFWLFMLKFKGAKVATIITRTIMVIISVSSMSINKEFLCVELFEDFSCIVLLGC
jgi:hypothetical protein